MHESENTSKRERSPDFSVHASTSQSLAAPPEDEHVLVLDMEDNSRGKKPGDRYVRRLAPIHLSHSGILMKNAIFTTCSDTGCDEKAHRTQK